AQRPLPADPVGPQPDRRSRHHQQQRDDDRLWRRLRVPPSDRRLAGRELLTSKGRAPRPPRLVQPPGARPMEGFPQLDRRGLLALAAVLGGGAVLSQADPAGAAAPVITPTPSGDAAPLPLDLAGLFGLK